MSTPRLALGFVLVVALLTPGASQSLAQPAAAPASPAASGSMLIVENAGQWPAAVRFQVWNSPLGAGTTWLAEDAIWLVITPDDKVTGWQGDRVTESNPSITLSSQIALKLTFPGSNPDVRIEPFAALTTTVNYFIGDDPAQWRPAVPVWGSVRYVNLYPGVDLVLGGPDSAWRLEASRGSAIDQVRVQVEGAAVGALNGTTLQLDIPDASLSLRLPSAPFAYQVVGGSRPGDSRALTVQPVQFLSPAVLPTENPADLLYGTFLGGGGVESGLAIVLDGVGSAYVTGSTLSDDFPTTPGSFSTNYHYDDAFVAKLNRAGSGLAYATFLGGGGEDVGFAVSVDTAGNAYVAGETNSGDFPTTPGAFDTSFNGAFYQDIFVVKLNPTGSGLLYATYLGGGNIDQGYGIVLDGAGSAFVTGQTFSADFPTTPGAFDTSLNDGDAFVAKLNPAGSGLLYATYLGGSSNDRANAIAMDGAGNALVTGYTTSGDFPTTPGAFDTSFNGGFQDAFVVKLNPTGGGLLYATYLGGGSTDQGDGIALDGTGSAYVSGSTDSGDFPTTPGAFDTSQNNYDAFVVKLNPAGSGLAYATFLGGSDVEYGESIAVDAAGTAYVAGLTYSSNFPTTPGAFDTSHNSDDAFVAKLNPAGSGLAYATFLGGSDGDYGESIAVDAAGSAYVTGQTYSDDFPTTPGAFATSRSNIDVFVIKLGLAPVVAPIEQPRPGTFVSGAVTLRGFAIDRDSAAGTGVDAVHIYLDGPYGAGTIIGAATYGLDRPDIAAQYGARFGPSGWELAWNTDGLAFGIHRLYLYARRTADNAWVLMEPNMVIVASGRLYWLPTVLRWQ